MPSTYSNLKIELIATGEQSGTWGTTTNTNLGTAVEEAITGSANVAFSSGDVTISLTNTNASQTARNLRLNLTGTSGGARVLTVPAIEKQYIINNGLADACTVKNSTGTGIAVPAGKTMVLFNDGTNVVDATTHLSSLTLSTDLAIAEGGTGASSATDARTNLGLGSIATQNNTAISISGGTITGLTNLTTTNFTASGTATLSGTTNLTGTATAVTQSASDNSTKIATTAYVDAATGTLGTMATQNASSVNITGGSITGLTTLSTSGGTISATTLTASTTLGVGAGWTVVQDGSNNLVFKYSGTSKMKLDSSGNLTVVGNVTAYGTV
jgi:two-component sensor histidine kinase